MGGLFGLLIDYFMISHNMMKKYDKGNIGQLFTEYVKCTTYFGCSDKERSCLMGKRKTYMKKMVNKARKKQERKYKISLKRLEEFQHSDSSNVIEQFYRQKDKK
ncbi:hypothetical protein ACJ2A9_07725 [Anaerobacillus sp. MEB173]|uniref:hypothetical protein n=1 Tax=Anaerobacillus sp. MEB173 TaxID=3383345 RepID=UPI003F8E6A0A